MSKPIKKLHLVKETVKDLSVRSNVKTGLLFSAYSHSVSVSEPSLHSFYSSVISVKDPQ